MLGTRILLSVLILVSVWGCAKHENLSKDCAVSADQQGSFMARVTHFPIDVTVDDQFNSQEREAISATVREWNELGQTYGVPEIFQLSYGSIPTALRTLDPHQCSSDMGGDHEFYVIREQNQAHWSSIGFVDTTPGATIRCYSSSGNDLERQIIYMNPSLLNAGQFDEAFSHEFGHALGLDHSCNGKEGDATFVGCKSLKGGASNPYFQAVMYPMLKNTNFIINVSTGRSSTRILNASSTLDRVSSVLQSNDKTRGQCVVGPTN